MKRLETIYRFKALLVGFVILLGNGAQAQVLYYNFNETGVTASNSGTGGTTYNLNIVDAAGTAVDLHTVSGTNLYGSSGNSLDLTSATKMGNSGGSNGSGPVAYSGSAGKVFGGLTTFTISGWYQGSSTPNSGARIFDTGNIRLFCNGSYMSFQYGNDSVNSNAAVGSQVYDATHLVTSVTGTAITSYGSTNPTFFAITYTYDTVGNTKTVTFYYGDSSSGSSLQSYSLTYTPSSTTYAATSLSSLFVGGNGSGASNIRPFDGYIDDFSVYSSVLDANTLNTLRVNQLLGIPEPQVYTMMFLGALGIFGLIRFRRYLFVSSF